MKYIDLEKYLFSISDEKFASFSKSLSNSDYISIGVKNPVLRQFIKDHLNDKELVLDEFKLGKYLEVDFIYFGLGVSRVKSEDEKLEFIFNNIFKAKSWAITDTISTYIKKLSFDKYWLYFKKYNDSKYIYTRRMSYILGLKVYKDERILEVLNYIKPNEEYMVMMAEAWLLSTIAIIYQDEIYSYLFKCDDLTLKRKTISKICDSFRFDDKSKVRFKSLRK